MAENTLTTWLPQSIVLDDLNGCGEMPSKMAYLISILTTHRYDSFRNYVGLNRKELQRVFTAKADVLIFARLADMIESDGKYIRGVHSKGYRLTRELRNQPAIAHESSCPRFTARVEKINNLHRANYNDLETALDEAMRGIELNIELAQFMDRLPSKRGVKSEVHRKNVIRASGSKIQAQEYGLIKISQKTGRVHCSINSLSKHIRQHLSFFGEPAVEIDLASSQPYFLASLSGNRAMTEAVSCGEFYTRINEKLNTPRDLDHPGTYGEFKQAVLASIYARPINGHNYWEDKNHTNLPIMLAMDQAYRGITQFTQIYRHEHGDTALPIAMQRLESGIFINGVLATLQLEEVPAIPIHDSILCRLSDADYIETLIHQQLIETTEISPKLRRSISA